MHRVLKAPLTELRNPGIECGLGEYIVFRFVHAEFMILLKYRKGLHTHTHIDTDSLKSSLYQEMLPIELLGVLRN